MTKRRKPLLTPKRVIGGSLVLLAIIIFGTWLLVKDANVAVLNPQGIIADQQKGLIIFTLILSLVVVIPVYLMIGIFAWKYREGNTKATYTPDVEGNRWLELLWWGIPIVIIGILGVVTVVSTHQLDPYKPLNSSVKPLNVQVVAMQWKWLFIYPDNGVASLNELRIPVGTPVNFSITADGPMSAMWIPNLGTQTYAMTGMSAQLRLQADSLGTYRGSNSNINGAGYADMNFNTIVTSKEDFDTWALSVEENKSHDHLDVHAYQSLANPSKANPVTYYHLHDTNLYTKLVDSYMSGNGRLTDGNADNHDHGDIE